MKRWTLSVAACAFAAALVLAAVAAAAIPTKISYQVMLTDAGHEPLAQGDYPMEFRIYDDPETGALLWLENQMVSVNEIGVASIMLGAGTPIMIDFDGPCYLEIEVGGETMEPRRELVSVPYAYHAAHADTLGSAVDVRTVDSGAQLTVTNDVIGPPVGMAFIRPGPGFFDWRVRDYGGDLHFDSSDDDGALWDPRVCFTRATGTIGVGIGTTIPSAELDVLGTIETESLRVTDGASVGHVLTSDVSGNATWQPVSGGTDADWTISGNDIYPTVSGNVGIGTTNPTAPLHVAGTNWDLDATEGDFKVGDDTYRLKMGVATGGGGAGSCGIRAMGGAERLILGAGSAEALTIDNTGTVSLGSSAQDAKLELYQSGVGFPVAELYSYAGLGGGFSVSDASGFTSLNGECDFDGGGGWFQVFRNSVGNYGFRIDGNYGGTGSPVILMSGTSTGAVFDMTTTGNDVVSLPQDAIGSSEILDEPGASSSTYGGGWYALDPLVLTTIRSSTITAPADGYALVIGTTQPMIFHSSGTDSSLDVGVSDSDSSLPENQDLQVRLDRGLASGTYSVPATAHGLFEVSAGSNTFYMLARENSGNVEMYDIQLTVIYIPSAYGTVSPTLAFGRNDGDIASSPAAPISAADIAAEQAESGAANDARIERELAEIRAEIEALKAQSGNSR